MAERHCENCRWRARYDTHPRSLLGRLWRWHAGWCPGFRKYLLGLSEEKRRELARRYYLGRYLT